MTLHVGDTAPRFTADLTSGSAPVNLTGASIAVHFKKPDGTVETLAATPDAPATGGKITAAPWGDILNQPGRWKAEAQVTYSDTTVQTFGPGYFVVKQQIA
jgi:hypothetical protein